MMDARQNIRDTLSTVPWVQLNKVVLEDVNAWGVGDVNFSQHGVSFRPRHEWVEKSEPTANFGSTGSRSRTVVDLTKPRKERSGAGISETPGTYSRNESQLLQNQVEWPHRGVPRVTPADIIICFLRTWGLRVQYNVFQVSAYPPAMFVEGVCKAQQAEMMILSQYLFLEKARQGKKKKTRAM